VEVNKVNLFRYFKEVLGFFIYLFSSLISLEAFFLSKTIKDYIKIFIQFILSRTYQSY